MVYRDYTEDDLKEVVLLMDDYQIPEDAVDKKGYKVLLSLKDRVLMALDNVRNGRY